MQPLSLLPTTKLLLRKKLYQMPSGRLKMTPKQRKRPTLPRSCLKLRRKRMKRKMKKKQLLQSMIARRMLTHLQSWTERPRLRLYHRQLRSGHYFPSSFPQQWCIQPGCYQMIFPRVSFVISVVSWAMYLRRVYDTDHTILTVATLRTVKPNWIRVVDCDNEYTLGFATS